jgi:hypothetical protein
MLIWILTLSLPLVFVKAYAQEATNVAFEQSTDQANNQVYKISYDLVAPFDNIACQVRVNFASPQGTVYLKQVSGDVGDLVYPGSRKVIIWNYVEELVHFSGDVNLSIEVTPAVKVPASVRRSKKLDVMLSPVLGTGKNFKAKLLLNKNEVGALSDAVAADQKAELLIPSKTRVKKNYQIAVTDGDKTYFSNTFRVRPKIGNGWKAAVILAIPAAIIITNAIKDNQPLPGPPSHN